jgi:hypothetical protein
MVLGGPLSVGAVMVTKRATALRAWSGALSTAPVIAALFVDGEGGVDEQPAANRSEASGARI